MNDQVYKRDLAVFYDKNLVDKMFPGRCWCDNVHSVHPTGDVC